MFGGVRGQRQVSEVRSHRFRGDSGSNSLEGNSRPLCARHTDCRPDLAAHPGAADGFKAKAFNLKLNPAQRQRALRHLLTKDPKLPSEATVYNDQGSDQGGQAIISCSFDNVTHKRQEIF